MMRCENGYVRVFAVAVVVALGPVSYTHLDVYKRQVLASVAGLAFVACTSLGLLFLRVARVDARRLSAALVVVAALALVAGTVMLYLHHQSLGGIANNELIASALVPDYGSAIIFHTLTGTAGCLCAALSLRRFASPRTALALTGAASILVLVAVFVTRIEFYQLHLTVGF